MGSSAAQLVLLLVVGLLGAALAATLATIYYGQENAAPTPAEAASAKPTAPTPPATASEAPALSALATHPSARENEREHAEAITANTQGRKAIVTSLEPKASTGRISIRSSEPATVYLYPSKEIIGTTPLLDFELPAGSHKLKVQVGEGKGRRKYFQIKVDAGGETSRSFNHW
jgi:hypothetical protein